jgi:hypothetical protein
LKKNGSAQGERAQEYVNISRPFDAAMGHFGQIPQPDLMGGTFKWLPSQPKLPLERQIAFPAGSLA